MLAILSTRSRRNKAILRAVFVCLVALLSACGGFPVDSFRPVIRSHPTAADEQFNLGIAYSILEREDLAAEAFGKSAVLNPRDADAWFEKGFALDIIGREEESSEAFIRAFGIREVTAKHFKLGLALYAVGRYADAAHELREAIEANEPHPITSTIRLARSLDMLDRRGEAVDVYLAAIRMNIDFAGGYYNAFFYLGVDRQLLGANREAVEAYREAIRRRPDALVTRVNLGAALLALGDRAAAMDEYARLAKADAELAEQLAGIIAQYDRSQTAPRRGGTP